jgi:hypothetical protein
LCDKCPVYIAAKNRDNEMKAELAVNYKNEHYVFDILALEA